MLATVLTDSSGNYAFTGVGPGSYQVAEVVQTNWVQTQPLYPTVYSFTVKSGHNLAALNFGDHASPALNPTQVIDNGQPGYSETGTWSTAVGGFNGTNRVAQTTHGSGATATATWSFTGVASGLVDVYVTFASQEHLLQGGTVHRLRRRHQPGHAVHQRVDPGDPGSGRSQRGLLRRRGLGGAGNLLDFQRHAERASWATMPAATSWTPTAC